MRVLLLDGKRRQKLESGYGQLAVGLKQQLEGRGVEVVFDERLPADVVLYVCPPYGIREAAFGLPVAVFTMHELEHLTDGKADWPAKLNRTDLVLTPTSWNRAVWKKLGVTTRIEVVPLGVDEKEFYPRWGSQAGSSRFTVGWAAPAAARTGATPLWHTSGRSA